MTSTTSIGTGGRLANRIRTGAATNHRQYPDRHHRHVHGQTAAPARPRRAGRRVEFIEQVGGLATSYE